MSSAQRRLLSQLLPQVRANCHRADASAAGHFSMCGLLLRLRNLYKWEQNIPPWQEEQPPKVLAWVEAREKLWEDLTSLEPRPLKLAGKTFDPMDAGGLNRILEPLGLVYGAGRAGGLKPAFFMGWLDRKYKYQGLSVYQVGEELGRDLFFLPGLRQNGTLFVRKGPLPYLLWDMIADPRARQARFIAHGLREYGLERAQILERPSWRALAPVVEGELEGILWHEAGEALADAQAANILDKTLPRFSGTELEFFVRAVKDLLADTGDQGRLAQIVAHRAQGQLFFYPAWLAGFSRMLFPEIDAAVLEFARRGDWQVIDKARRLGLDRAREAVRLLLPILHGQNAEDVLSRTRREVIKPLTGSRSPSAR